MLWEQATPVGGEQVPVGCPLADDEFVVLREMAKGLKDEAIATKLGISKSTVGRRVTERTFRGLMSLSSSGLG
jgi:DNA-binding NarL/FixJ family response regulator